MGSLCEESDPETQRRSLQRATPFYHVNLWFEPATPIELELFPMAASSKIVHVRGLKADVTSQEVKDNFSAFGEIDDIVISADR